MMFAILRKHLLTRNFVANPGSPGKWPLKWTERETDRFTERIVAQRTIRCHSYMPLVEQGKESGQNSTALMYQNVPL